MGNCFSVTKKPDVAAEISVRAHAPEIIVRAFDSLLQVAGNVPVISIFVPVLQICYKTCTNVLVSKASAKQFQDRLEEVANIIEMAWQQHSSNKLIFTFIEDLQAIVQDATKTITDYTEVSYFEKLLLGTIPSEEFQYLDNRIKVKLTDMIAALSIVNVCLSERTYEGVQEILHRLGGFENVLERKLDQFLGYIGAEHS